MIRALIISCIISVLAGCMNFNEKPYGISAEVSDPHQRYYIANGVSFLPPALTGLKAVIHNDSVSFGFYYRDYGAYGSVGVSSSIGSSEYPITPKWESDADSKRGIAEENKRRAQILAVTMEEHWQVEKKRMSIRDMVARMQVRKDGKLVRVIPHFDKSEWESIAKDSFMYHLSRERVRLKGLPDNTYRTASIKGVDCLQLDFYRRLGAPLGEFDQATGGGIEHYRSYNCYIRPDFTILVAIGMDMAPGIELEYDKILRPLLESIEIDETLPNTYTTFSIMAKNKWGQK